MDTDALCRAIGNTVYWKARAEKAERERDEALAAIKRWEDFWKIESGRSDVNYDEVKRLRKAIENAPCPQINQNDWNDAAICYCKQLPEVRTGCWKRAALKVESDE